MVTSVGTEVVSWSQDDRDLDSSSRGAGRWPSPFFICTTLLTATCFSLSMFWGATLEGVPQFLPYVMRNKTDLHSGAIHFGAVHSGAIHSVARLFRPTLDFGNLAPASNWKYSAEAFTKVRNATMRLHPDTHTVKLNLGKLSKQATGEFGHYNTCAVVANSGILLGSRCGTEIDSKDYVIRIDLPLIRGFEKDVGRRTNMTMLNSSTPKRIKKSSHLKNRTKDVYERRLRDIDGTVLVGGKNSKSKIMEAVKLYKLSFLLLSSRSSQKSGLNKLASTLGNKKFGGNPTTGLVTVLMMTTFCDHPYLYGFFPFQKDAKNTPIPYHYYPGDFIKPIEQNAGGHHHMAREYDFFRDLHKQGVLKMQVGPCEGK
ncbi:alpha-2,8-sialyltransferase 8B-like [Branchiostoma lanceolatum]|uniref:alpha-2,8-sialyltransferase 8B-like n=1 Tax=Branchiostoma lanceolatum TaxID=7740 RepID=UPI0034557F2C